MMCGLLARFGSEHALVDAAMALTERGYRTLDAFTPRPIAALEDALRIERSSLTRSVLIAAVTGAAIGLGVQWFCNAWDSPLNVGGRPPFALPAFVPIAFEIMILFAAVTAFVAALRRGGLPQLSHPLFAIDGFERASCDAFFLFVSADDSSFEAENTRAQLLALGAEQVSAVPAAPFGAATSERPERDST